MEKKLEKNISYVLRFIDGTRFIASSLSNLVNNLSEGIHRIKCKIGQDDKKYETREIKYQYYDCFREYTHFKHDLVQMPLL